MKKGYISFLAIAIAASLTITGCKKDSAPSTTDTKVFFSMGADNSIVPFVSVANPGGPAVLSIAPNVAASGNTGVAWITAAANISAFKLDAKKDGTAFEVIGKGLTNVDIFTISQLSTSPTIPVGNYTNVEVHVLLTSSGGGSNLPLILTGIYVNKTGVQAPIELDFNDNAEIIATTGNFNVDGSANVGATLALHLDKLLANVTIADMDQTARTTIGSSSNGILISPTDNQTVYAKILANIAGAGGASLVPVKK